MAGAPPYITALIRHFGDLRDGHHNGAVSRVEKEALFIHTAELLDPVATDVLAEMNRCLLLDRGVIVATPVRRRRDGGLSAVWRLGWEEQARAYLPPISLVAGYGVGFHHPHLRGATVGDWPLNVFDDADAAGQRETLRAIASAELHNLVFEADFRIVPAITAVKTTEAPTKGDHHAVRKGRDREQRRHRHPLQRPRLR